MILYIITLRYTGVCEQKQSSGEKHMWEGELSERQLRGWGAVSASDLHGKGSPKRNALFTGTVMPFFAARQRVMNRRGMKQLWRAVTPYKSLRNIS